MTDLSERVKRRMKEKGWVKGDGEPNPAKLRDEASIGYATAYNIIHGKNPNPTIPILEKIGAALTVSVEWLRGRDDDFDVRAYEMGKEDVARAVEDALRDALSTPPPGGPGGYSDSGRFDSPTPGGDDPNDGEGGRKRTGTDDGE